MDKRWMYQILDDLAEEAIPTKGTPWPIFQAILAKSGRRSRRRIYPRRTLRVRVVFLVVLLLLVGLFTTPQGRVWAQSLLRFFVPTQQDPSAVPLLTATPLTLVEVTPMEAGAGTPVPVVEPACSESIDTRCTLPQAQSLVSFPLQQLGALPGNLYFKGASVAGERVTAQYECPQGCTLWLEQEKRNGRPVEPMPVGSTANVEAVQIGNFYGEYVQGSYYGADAAWNADDGVSMLRWQQDDVLYSISMVQSGAPEALVFPPGSESLVSLAESLTGDLSLTWPPNPDFLTRVADAQALAGFRVYEPAKLPDDYHFGFATYDAQSQFVCLNYVYKDASFPSLFLRQSLTAPLTELQAAPGAQLVTTRLEIDGADGEVFYSIGFATPQGACDRQNNIFRAGQALLWRAQGMSFELYGEFRRPFGGAGLLQEELVALAESVNGVSTVAGDTFDPARLKSIAEAERVAGYEIQAPTRLPVGSAFEFASYQDGSVMSLYSSQEMNTPNLSLYQCPAVAPESVCRELLDEIPLDFREAVTVQGVAAVFAQGALGKTPEEQGYTWHLQDPTQMYRLYWRVEGWDYLLVSMSGLMDRDTLAAIAESIR